MNVYGNALMTAKREGQQQSGQNGTEERIAMKVKLATAPETPAILATAVIWGYLGLRNRLPWLRGPGFDSDLWVWRRLNYWI